MRHKRAVFFWIIIMALLMVSFYFDKEISQFFELIRFDALNNALLGVTYVSSGIIIFFILTSLFLWQEKKRRWIMPLWATLAISTALSFILKYSIQRARPFQAGIVSTLPSLIEKGFSTWNFSFPSYQAMIAFCAIPILNKEFPRLKYFWWAFAVLIALSRVYFGLHYFSDVFVGAIIGLIVGSLILNLEKEKKFFEGFMSRITK